LLICDIIDILKDKKELMSISQITRELNKQKQLSLNRLEVSGYLKAITDIMYLGGKDFMINNERIVRVDISPSICFTLESILADIISENKTDEDTKVNEKHKRFGYINV